MKCLTCNSFSFNILCDACASSFFNISISNRILADDLVVYSFYPYSEVEEFIKTKHTHIGSKVFNVLSKYSFKNFSKEFYHDRKVYALPIDDKLSKNYSHTAILAKSLKSKIIKPKYSVLRAKNNVNYSAKSLEFRLKNPRDFEYSFKRGIDVILVDDIITTGTTLSEAKQTLKKYDVNVLFALTLADARL